uniref:Uncharacterized protein n=1 Tax=Glossina morsitans morsitans TaxID=37546 RepID=A0A1B0G0I9_GLOMM
MNYKLKGLKCILKNFKQLAVARLNISCAMSGELCLYGSDYARSVLYSKKVISKLSYKPSGSSLVLYQKNNDPPPPHTSNAERVMKLCSDSPDVQCVFK